MANYAKKETTTVKVDEKKEKVTADVVTVEQKLSDVTAQLAKALDAINQLQQNQSNSVQPTSTVEPVLKGKKIKVVSLMHYLVNLSTDPMGQGKIFVFEDYGSTIKIKFDDLEDCYASYRKTFEDGSLYIADADAVEELGLTEDYQKIYDKKTVDKIILLKTELEVDMFLNMSTDLRDSTARAIADRMVSGEKYDLNLTHRIEQEADIDFEKMVSDIKSYQRTE